MVGGGSVFDNETFHRRLGALAFAAILWTLLTIWMIELKASSNHFLLHLAFILSLNQVLIIFRKTDFRLGYRISQCCSRPSSLSWRQGISHLIRSVILQMTKNESKSTMINWTNDGIKSKPLLSSVFDYRIAEFIQRDFHRGYG